MKHIVERARRLSRTVAVGIRRAVDPPLDDRATPLDIRHVIVESVERRVQPAGHGRRVLPRSARLALFAERQHGRARLPNRQALAERSPLDYWRGAPGALPGVASLGRFARPHG